MSTIELTAIQKKILKLLTLNCRYTPSEIASAVGVSVPAVTHQIKQLLSVKKVGSPVTIFDGRPFGFKIYYLFLKFNQNAISYEKIKKLPQLIAVIETLGNYDVLLIVHLKDSIEMQPLISTINQITTNAIQSYASYEHLQEHKWNYALSEYDVPIKQPKAQKNVSKPLAKENQAAPYIFGNDTVDELDKKIIKKLLADPMCSYIDIARYAKTTHEVVRYRLKNYIKKRWISAFSVTPDFASFGYFSYIVLIKLRTMNHPKTNSFIQSRKYIWYSGSLEGQHNLAIYLGTKDPLELASHIKEIRAFFGSEVLDLQFLLFEKEQYNQQFPHQLLE